MHVPLTACILGGFSRFLIGYLYTLFNILINQLKNKKWSLSLSLQASLALALAASVACPNIPKHWENEISLEKNSFNEN